MSVITVMSSTIINFNLNVYVWISGTEQVDTSAQPLSAESRGQQKVGTGTKHKRILCFDSSGEGRPQTGAISTLSPATNTSASQKKDSVPVARTRPNILGGNRPKRRLQPVRCSKDPQTKEENIKDADKSTEPVKKPVHKQAHDMDTEGSAGVAAGTANSSQHQAGKQSDPERRAKAAVSKDKDTEGTKAGADQSSRAVPSNSEGKKDESSKKDPPGKVLAKPREGRVEKRAPSQEVPSVTANKENEIKDTVPEQQAPSSSSPAKAFSPQPVPDSQPRTPKAPSKTSSLAKQAAEMLHDIQGHGSPSEPAGHNQEEPTNAPRTPGRQKKGKDGEGTPKHLPPNTPDIPSCSPASEAGSENSINMAAHTLMILSRATIARTGTPLKDSLRQDGVGEKIPSGSKNSKKRKLNSPTDTPPAKKDRVSVTQMFMVRLGHAVGREQEVFAPHVFVTLTLTLQERKKLMDCFPHDLDVDKFLSSLHYDE